jgi:hypothetical protein
VKPRAKGVPGEPQKLTDDKVKQRSTGGHGNSTDGKGARETSKGSGGHGGRNPHRDGLE